MSRSVLNRCDAILQRRSVRIGDAGFDGLIQAVQTPLGVRELAAQDREATGKIVVAFGLAIHQAAQEFGDALRRQQLFADALGHGLVEPFHRQRASWTGILALLRRRRANIVAIAPRLAGADRHPTAQVAQVARPVSRIGPVTTRGGATFGLGALSCACTASKIVASMIGSTGTMMCSVAGFAVRVFESVRLKCASPL
jgi:hypothetical protein